jgi:hypothetical protein
MVAVMGIRRAISVRRLLMRYFIFLLGFGAVYFPGGGADAVVAIHFSDECT